MRIKIDKVEYTKVIRYCELCDCKIKIGELVLIKGEGHKAIKFYCANHKGMVDRLDQERIALKLNNK